MDKITITSCILAFFISLCTPMEFDKKGYILYCPCMGRFGNQADHFLGSLAWAKAMDRTLVLPPWVEYHPEKMKSVQVPFDTYFRVSQVAKYHRVMTMERFMKKIAPEIWPPGQRTVYCYMERKGGSCNAKEGNPFGPFWDNFGVDFNHSKFYGPLSFGGDDPFERDRWNKRFPVENNLVMAFMGAPAPFPVRSTDRHLHMYLQWSKSITQRADDFISANLPRPYIGIHLRNGIDWRNACSHIDENRSDLFASSQCLGDRGEHGRVYKDLCYPPDEVVVQQVARHVTKRKAISVFVATDDRDLLDAFKVAMPQTHFSRLPSDDPHLDLAIVARADYAIVNCVSTFSAFITRERTVAQRPTGFWAFPRAQVTDKFSKQDL